MSNGVIAVFAIIVFSLLAAAFWSVLHKKIRLRMVLCAAESIVCMTITSICWSVNMTGYAIGWGFFSAVFVYQTVHAFHMMRDVDPEYWKEPW